MFCCRRHPAPALLCIPRGHSPPAGQSFLPPVRRGDCPRSGTSKTPRRRSRSGWSSTTTPPTTSSPTSRARSTRSRMCLRPCKSNNRHDGHTPPTSWAVGFRAVSVTESRLLPDRHTTILLIQESPYRPPTKTAPRVSGPSCCRGDIPLPKLPP